MGHAQWSGFGSSEIYSLGVHDTFIFLSTYVAAPEILRHSTKTDFQDGWDIFTKDIDPNGGNITTFASLGTVLMAGSTPPNTGNGYFSTDDGMNWSDPIGGPVGTNGTYLFAQYASRVARSRDGGQTWEHLSAPAGYNYHAADSFVAAPTIYGNYLSSDSGGTWRAVTTTASPLSFSAFAMLGTTMFAGDSGLFRSTDLGAHWALFSLKDRIVNTLLAYKTYLFAGTDSGVYISFDSGVTWKNVSQGMIPLQHYNSDVTALIVYDSLLLAAVNNGINNFGDVVSAFNWRPLHEMTDTTQSGVQAVASSVRDSIDVFPNPASGMVTIFTGNTPVIGLRVLNILGETMLSLSNPYQSNISLDLSNYPSGTYFLSIETLKGTVLRKMVRE